MKIITFLGNPGKKYINNRHNIGFLSGEYVAQTCGVVPGKKEFSSVSAKTEINGESVLLLFPQTYMNKSGEAVSKAVQFYKADVSDIIVIHDELELSFGDIRMKKGGGHKGHNGIRSIAAIMGSADFFRIRFGIGRPENEHISVADYVLSDFSKDEREKLDGLYKKVYDMICEIIS